MSNSVTKTSIYLMPGMSVEITCPVNLENVNGFYAWPESEDIPRQYFPGKEDRGESMTPINGFIVEDETVGEIIESDAPELGVIYTHNRPAPNAVHFFADTGERAVMNIMSVPIHDHSTIVHGGPAYGTYFDDDTER